MKKCPICQAMNPDTATICRTQFCTFVFPYNHDAQLRQVARIYATYPKGTVYRADL